MEPFKNVFSFANSKKLARALKKSWADFPERKFLQGLESQLNELELKDRMNLLSERVSSSLPANYKTKVGILLGALAKNDEDPHGLQGFLVWPLTSLIAREGLEHFEVSMKALKEMTKRFTAEFDVRPFLEKHPEKSLKLLEKWARDPDPHVRRWVSEGTRPRLPWGRKLKSLEQDPELTRSLLEILKLDESEYVRKSVANHLNDHSKTHPEWVVGKLQAWTRKHPDHEGLAWISRHACRSLIKAGHTGALNLHGFGPSKDLGVRLLELSPRKLKVGEDLIFRIEVRNKGSQASSALVDYVIHHRKANGSLTPKVFKGRKKLLQPGEKWILEGRHKFRKITTRTYFSGEHLFAVQLNGQQGKTQAFDLRA